MEIEFDSSARGDDPLEVRFPELVVALLDPALDVNAQRQSGDLRTCLQNGGNRVPAIRRKVLGCDTDDRVVRLDGLFEVVALRPEPELEL